MNAKLSRLEIGIHGVDKIFPRFGEPEGFLSFLHSTFPGVKVGVPDNGESHLISRRH